MLGPHLPGLINVEIPAGSTFRLLKVGAPAISGILEKWSQAHCFSSWFQAYIVWGMLGHQLPGLLDSESAAGPTFMILEVGAQAVSGPMSLESW